MLFTTLLQDLPADAPVLILFPGLTGGSGDSYVQHAVLQARHAGIRAAVFNSRGTADSPVITPQFYSASFTDDTREVREAIQQHQSMCVYQHAGHWVDCCIVDCCLVIESCAPAAAFSLNTTQGHRCMQASVCDSDCNAGRCIGVLMASAQQAGIL